MKHQKFLSKKTMVFFAIYLMILVSCTSSFTRNEDLVLKQIDEKIKTQWDNYIGTHPILPKPFTIALGDQEYLYYWDIYFVNKGLIVHNRLDLVKDNIDNFIFEIDTFGYIPNATVSWGYDRSQPPFFSMMVRDYYDAVETKDTTWLRKAYRAALDEYAFWNDESEKADGRNSTTVPGLSRYGYLASDEVLESVYDGIRHRFPDLPQMTEEEKLKFGADIIAECATGMDFTWRFQQRCTDFIAVDLNSNLYAYEKNFVWFENKLGINPSRNWDSIAEVRKQLIYQYCWDDERGLFTDYDFVNNRLNPVASMAMFWPLYWQIASKEQAKRTLANLPIIETQWGIRATEVVESPYTLQWDYNAIWPPVQLMAHGGLKNYGFKRDAHRIANKYVKLVATNFLEPEPASYYKDGEIHERKAGYIWEKYSIDGTINDADYPSHEMMGWSAGVFVYFLSQDNMDQ